MELPAEGNKSALLSALPEKMDLQLETENKPGKSPCHNGTNFTVIPENANTVMEQPLHNTQTEKRDLTLEVSPSIMRECNIRRRRKKKKRNKCEIQGTRYPADQFKSDRMRVWKRIKEKRRKMTLEKLKNLQLM